MFEHDYKNYPELSNSQLQEMQFSSPHKQIVEDFDALVVKVHDGDTITLRADFRDFDFPLRLLDVDAPELSEGGEKTREWLKQRILGKNVHIVINPLNRVGKYGRLLGQVMFQGSNVGLEELHLGLSSPFGKKNESQVKDVNYFVNKKWLKI